MTSKPPVAPSAIKLGLFLCSLGAAALGAKLAAANISPGAESQALGRSAARQAGGSLSDQALFRLNPEHLSLFDRHDPGIKPPLGRSLLADFETGPPPARWPLSPQQALAINEATPISRDANPAAKPFIFRGGSADRAAASMCLTQAVYYEAGYEPIKGAQAVAQVVLNRVRHPIFPKSVCGVVYQGANLRTGCQFSFACDGSLHKTPAAVAWARAKSVAEHALDGFVQKDVGEATHYHTQWVMPWWAPTVTKVAQVGAQVFYRWPGALGAPKAFSAPYAGVERAGPAVDLGSSASPQVVTRLSGRVHTILASEPKASRASTPADTAAPAAVTATMDPAPLPGQTAVDAPVDGH